MANILPNDVLIRRLAIVKYLFNLGVQQSYQVETVAGFSILAFHDSIEMFLQLVAENKGDKGSDVFMSYWDKYPELTLKESIRNLKDRRVNIKHKGLLPAKNDIEVSRITALEFFNQNTPLQFNLSFENISLTSLVSYTNVRDYLQEAEKSLSVSNYYECLINTKKAFLELLTTYENTKYSGHINIGNKVGDEYKKLVSDDKYGAQWFRNITATTNHLRDSLNNLQDSLKITALGIDYRKYSLFNLITPYTEYYVTSKGMEYHSISKERYEERFNIRQQDCQFCIDFVVDSALKLQEFDFDIKTIFK